ncbi:ArsI/CadI family heavy metal resistance metalloenzyme [Nocardia lijiangensis]|uniref:ArsI/CadI family heavy metal resistance metalloenzyme n=1 Tax=Nocardia lijiangensis TaxID=299618 RepID=UPI000829B920|nr:ArsI/CadI family heavy metal resistance metalloenzyme [Nocardia lijiangensis]
MSRVQLALNVDDIDAAVAFYSTLFAAEPAKRKPGYANFAIADPPLKLVLIENRGAGGSVNHLGVEVETSAQVHSEIARLSAAGLFTEEQIATTCCFATQDKVWVGGPDAERWEVYTVLADSDTFGAAPEFADDDAEAVQACCTSTAPAGQACCTPQAKEEAIAGGATCCR